LDNAKQGAVLISFGSLAESNRMSAPMRHSLLRAFSRFPDYQFLWKLDKESEQNDSALLAETPNVHTFEWVQQMAILAHPKMRAFISHCGWNSINEAAESGVPILGVPLFADQPKNALLAQHRGLALYLDVKQLNGPEAEEIMAKMLEEVGRRVNWI
jgi:glucuronosyltransferase